MPYRLLWRLVAVLSAAVLGLGLAVAPQAAEPAQAAVGSVLRLSSTAYATPGERTALTITWVHNGEPVTGRVNLQRLRNGTWELVRQIQVSDGAATTYINPGGSNSYRLRTSRVDSPAGVPTAHPDGTSNTISIRLTTNPKRSAAPDLVASPTATTGSRIAFTITWTVAGAPVSGVVNLQRWSGSRWVLQQRVTVTGGRASVTRAAADEVASLYLSLIHL